MSSQVVASVSGDSSVEKAACKQPFENMKIEEPNSVEKAGERNESTQEKYPYYVFLIIMNEFCERMSFYGMRAVLFFYLTRFVGESDDSATAIYHAFTMLCYFTPLLGAILADGFLGLYKTIVGFSIIYFVGELIVTLTSITPLGAPNIPGPVIGLFIIAIGNGGIKPCTAAFGGNQFAATQTKYIETYFSIVYMSINVGSLISTFLTPILRGDVKCFGNECYPLAFGVPAAFMLLSIVMFVLGTSRYRRDDELGAKGLRSNIITQTAGCIWRALRNRLASAKSSGQRAHWLDYADDIYASTVIEDVKAFSKVFFVFIPLPIFWALYDQQGSRWTDQAQQLDGRLGASFTIKPEQFQIINPIMIVALAPVFDYVLYPLFARINLLKSLLQRMAIGLALGIAAFLIAALLEHQMQVASAALNLPNQIRVVNLAPCDWTIRGGNNSSSDEPPLLFVPQSTQYRAVNFDKATLDNLFGANRNATALTFTGTCSGGSGSKRNVTSTVTLDNSELPKSLIVQLNALDDDGRQSVSFTYLPYNGGDQLVGSSQIKFFSLGLQNVALKAKLDDGEAGSFDVLDLANASLANVRSKGERVDNKLYKLNVVLGDDSSTPPLLTVDSVLMEICARYSILLFTTKRPHGGDQEQNSTRKMTQSPRQLEYVLLTDIYPNGLHLGWQAIQYFVMTLGEIMFSISGVTFSYAQAPESMKSVIQALWYLTVAFGNLLVVIVAQGSFFNNQVHEYIAFAALLGVATIVFSVMAFFYKPISTEQSKKSVQHNQIAPIDTEINSL